MKILYLSCHSVLEFDELKLFNELGYELFSPGSYFNPNSPADPMMRPGLSGFEYDPDIVDQYNRIGAAHPGEDGKNYLTKEFVDNFDVVIVMHIPDWIKNNWAAIKHKPVIWRTIGQSVASTEQGLAPYRDQGLKIVRYSSREVNIPHFIGQDALIRFYKDPAEYGSWNGKKKRVITFAQSMQQRGSSCNYSLFERVTRPFTRALFGPQNNQPGFGMGKVPYKQLKQEMRDNRVYFYTGTHPASYTLNFMEAWMNGIPMVCIGPQNGNAAHLRNHNLYEIPDLIQNEVNGFISDNENQLRDYIMQLLRNDKLASRISSAGRQEAIRHFGKDMIKASWKNYLEKM